MAKVVIKHVARRAGVSQSTVSRFYNGKSHISPQTALDIEQAAKELGFKPKITTRNQHTLKSRTIGVIIPSFNNRYISSVLQGLLEESKKHSKKIVVESYHWHPSREKKIIKNMLDIGVEGIVFFMTNQTEAHIKEQVGETPVLFVGGIQRRHFPHLSIDNVIGGAIATRHLIQCGHRDILHIHGPLTEEQDATERLSGYKLSLQEAGIPVRNSLIINGAYHSETSYHAVCRALESGIEFSAIFAANDTSAYGAIRALKQFGLCVPDDISVIGFDDLITSEMCSPPLTTMKQPLKEMGSVALKKFCLILIGADCDVGLPPAELVIRNSTKQIQSN